MATPQEPVGMGCLALFSLPFVGAGLLLLGVGAGVWREYLSVQEWTPVKARLERVEVVTTRGSKGSVSRRLELAYAYEVGGRSWTSTRVAAGDDTSQFVDEGERLERHRDSGEPVDVYVNPLQPSEAIFFRALPFTALILPAAGVVFGGAGAGLLAIGLGSLFAARRRTRLAAQFPGRPWRHDTAWQGFERRAGSDLSLAVLWACTAWLSTFISIFVLAVASNSSAPLAAQGIIACFTVLPIGLGYFTVMKTLRRVKFGRPTLQLARLPVGPGEVLEGAIVVGTPLDASAGVKLVLRCTRTVTSGTGKSRTTTTTTVHEEPVEVREESLRPGFHQGTIIPVRVKVPAGLPESGPEGGNLRHAWELEAKSAGAGVDFEATFELPVYRVDERLVERRPEPLPA